MRFVAFFNVQEKSESFTTSKKTGQLFSRSQFFLHDIMLIPWVGNFPLSIPRWGKNCLKYPKIMFRLAFLLWLIVGFIDCAIVLNRLGFTTDCEFDIHRI